MFAPRTVKSLLITAVIALSVVGCSGLPPLRPAEEVILPIAADQIPDVNWPTVRNVHWLVAEYIISPSAPLFQSGQAYRLIIRNTGDQTHVLDGQDFFNALAIKSVKMSAFAGHTGDDHVDPPIGAKGLEGVPILPKRANISSITSEADDGDSANPFAADNDEKDEDTSDPFADDKTSDPFTDDKEGGDQNAAANPFAELPRDDSEAAPAKEPVDTDVKVKDLTSPEQDQEPIIEDAADDDVKDPAGTGKIASDKDIEEVVDDEPVASADDGDEDSKSETAKETAPANEVWAPLQISEVTIEPGHETTLEFVALRPGRYGLGSARALPIVFGMFTVATIEAPVGETITAKAEAAE